MMVLQGKAQDIKVPLEAVPPAGSQLSGLLRQRKPWRTAWWWSAAYTGTSTREYRDAMTAMGVSYLEDSCAFLEGT